MPDVVPNDASSSLVDSKRDADFLRHWQTKLLPLMARLLLGITIFFFVASLAQLSYLHWRIEQTTVLDVREPMQLLRPGPTATESEKRQSAALLFRGLLEVDSLQRRHQQGRVFLMARVWTVYLGFITGMSLALVGAAFILGRIQGSQTNATLEAGQVKAQILASSPGIILSFLGTILMVTTIMVNHTIRIEDQNIYLRGGSEASSPPSVDPDVLRFPSFPGLPGESASSPRK